MKKILIRKAEEKDIPALYQVAALMKATHEEKYFERCLQEQAASNRTVYVAEDEGVCAGYVQLNWRPTYIPFLRLGIPEIQDLNVIPAARRNGLGGLLVDVCENAARDAGKTDMGISVGLYARFGAAQRLYVRKGYVPDGAGAAYDDIPVAAGEMRAVDDLLTLKLVKALT